MKTMPLVASSKVSEFEVLLFTYFDGWTGFAYDENDDPVGFATIEEALADLQSAFSIWAKQIASGERARADGYSPNDFAIRSRRSGELYRIAASRNKVFLRT